MAPVGRPALPPGRRRQNLTIRIRSELREMFVVRAAGNGRSLSEEIEFTLEQSLAKRGRPPRIAEGAGRYSLGLKVTANTKSLIDTAARVAGRTQSQEAEYRLQASFDEDRLIARIIAAVQGEAR